MKLSKAIDAYLSYKNTHTKPGTIKTYEQQLKLFLVFVDDKELEDIELGDITAFQQDLRGKYSLGTVNFTVVIVKGLLFHCKRLGLKVAEPALIRAPRFVPNSHNSITYPEYQRLEAAYNDFCYEECQKKLMIRMLYETGIRISELCDITICDLDSVNPFTIIETKKTYDKRYIQWSSDTHKILLKVLGVRLANGGEYLFMSSKGRLLPRTAQRWVKEASKLAGIEKNISPHSFRHGKAHRMAELGADLIKIKTVMGHADPKSSFKYLNFSQHEIKRMAEEFL